MFERAAVVELEQLAAVLEPPCQLGPYRLTARLARSQTALVFTASGGPFDADEGVLKVATSHYASRQRAELQRLVQCSDAGVRGVVWPVLRDQEWLAVPGMLDAHIAAIALPFLTGGDLYAIKRARRPGLTNEALRVIANTLRHLLELPTPMTHGGVSMRNALLPRPGAELSELTLIDLGSAVELSSCTRREAEVACKADVIAFGAAISELGTEMDGLARACREGRYASMADSGLWRALAQPKRKWFSLWRR